MIKNAYEPMAIIHMYNQHTGPVDACQICTDIQRAGIISFEQMDWDRIVKYMHVEEYTCEFCKKQVSHIDDFVRGRTLCRKCAGF